MRRKRYRKRRAVNIAERGYTFWAFLCLFILLSFCYKEEFSRMVFSQMYWKETGSEKKEASMSELAFAFVDSGYGFFLKNPQVEELSELTANEINPDENAKDYFLNHFGQNETESETENETENKADESNEKNISANSDENGNYVNQENPSQNADEAINPSEDVEIQADDNTDLSPEELMIQENQKAANGVFQKQEAPVFSPDYESLQDFTYLKQHYYTVDPTTTVTAENLDYQKLSSYDAVLKQDNSLPQILIYHTHSQEGFRDSVTGDPSTTIVGVGEKLTQILREEYGFNVIHDTGTYDVPNRDYAYSVSAPAIEKILQENPSIEVIIDLHRDGVAAETHLVKEVGGRQTAQFMFFNGISYLNATGPIDYLQNPYTQQNLAFSFQMKMAADRFYPGFARNIYLKGLRYNMHYREKSLLIEVGAQTNTIQEAMNAADPIAHILAVVLKGET